MNDSVQSLGHVHRTNTGALLCSQGILMHATVAGFFNFCRIITLLYKLIQASTKMNSLYQIRSKMLHGTKVIILVEKKIQKDVTWLGFELTTFILEVESAYHSTMDPSY